MKPMVNLSAGQLNALNKVTIFSNSGVAGVSTFDYNDPSVPELDDIAKFDHFDAFDRAIVREGKFFKTQTEAEACAKEMTIKASRPFVVAQHLKNGLFLCIPKDLAGRL